MMRRQFAVLGAVAMVLSACSSNDEATTPEPTPTTSSSASDEASATPSPDPAPSQSPRPASTPTLPEGFEPPSASGDADAEPDADDAATEDDTADAGPSRAPMGSFATSSSSAQQSSPFATLAEPVARSKGAGESCQVKAAAGETITSCATGLVSSRGDQAFAVVVARDDASGAVTTRLFSDAGGGTMVATSGVDTGASEISATHWWRGDELIQFTLGGTQYVVGWDAGAAPKVVASFDAGAQIDLIAGRIVQRGGGTIRVFAPSTSGSTGTQVATTAGDPAPVDVSLQVYDKWIAGDWSGMAGLAVPSVIDALRSAHTTTDLFVLQGTDCASDGEQAVCTFDSNGQRTTWRLERLDGKVQVVDLK